MGGKKPAWLSNILPDRFKDLWELLSETTNFLSRTEDFYLYEQKLRTLRAGLQAGRNNSTVREAIRGEIIQLRKDLRALGYDLSIARQVIRCEGFRNDACLAEGFRRVVIAFTSAGIFWLAGDDNHLTLSEFLDARLDGMAGKQLSISSKHYLWYRRRGHELILSGADTELKEDFERLEKIIDLNPLKALSALKELK
jgi:hypothetical protein